MADRSIRARSPKPPGIAEAAMAGAAITISSAIPDR